jgi:hypothetical protein
MPTEPIDITIRMFNVGFGDCFLLTFHYAEPLEDQHILIDFGSVSGKADMAAIAQKIKAACNGKLYAVVATHRHRDHISGFSDAGGKGSPGAIIASCKPRVVLQPWTENPDAGANDRAAPIFASKSRKNGAGLFLASLNSMHSYAAMAEKLASQWRPASGRMIPLERLAAANTKNSDAVRNLREMGTQKPRFLSYGAPSGLENPKLLPGVKVHVLGPPALKQQNLKKYAKGSSEYWLATRFWAMQANAVGKTGTTRLFPNSPHYGKNIPNEARWFIRHAETSLKQNVRGIVTILDSFLNNTSLILLFEVKGRKLLFPGDAQLENWQWAFSQPGIQELLKDVDVYKVGHHGSRNATPRKLWEFFDKRKEKKLTTLMSTASDVYGRSDEGKVPSSNLENALNRESDLKDSRKLKTPGKALALKIDKRQITETIEA